MSLGDDIAAHAAAAESTSKGRADVDSDGVTFINATVDQAAHDLIANGDWSPIFAVFSLDPAAFEVVDDTVRMSTWQQSKRTDTGDRDVVQLYAYSARFRRITHEQIPRAQINEWRSALKTRSRATKPVTAGLDGATYVILIADSQLGKKGTAEAVENWKRGVLAHVDAIRRLGPLVKQVHVAYQGDETENVANSYGNQAYTIELNLSAQLSLDFDMRVWTFKVVLELGKPVSASSVRSNHGEFTRNGSKDPVTSQNDNSSTYIAGEVKKLFDELDAAGVPNRRIDWTIGDTHPGVTVTLSGVDCYFSHGYVEKGRGGSSELRTRNAIEKQIIGRTEDLGTVAIWFMAHYHHLWANTFSGRTVFGCPAIEAEKSSEYMLDQYGEWSRPGVLGMLVGASVGRDKWSHLNVW